MSSKQSNFFFRFEPKRTETQSVSVVFRFFGLFRETKQIFFRFVLVCFGVSVLYRNNRNKLKQTEKISKKQISIRVSSKQLIYFWFKLKQTETQPVLVVFRETKQKFVRFVTVFRTSIETTETNRTNCM